MHVIVTRAKQILCTEKDFAVPADFGYCRCPNAGVIAPNRG
jgi:hypothetical protein